MKNSTLRKEYVLYMKKIIGIKPGFRIYIKIICVPLYPVIPLQAVKTEEMEYYEIIH